MPVFDWTRSDLAYRLPDGSTVLAYEKEKIEQIDPKELVERMERSSLGYSLPGWEPERLKTLKTLFEMYEGVTEEDLLRNCKYFLEQIIPTAEEVGIRMAIHPDDPPWSVFGLPRIVTNKRNLERIVNCVDSPSNGLTLCTGSLGSNRKTICRTSCAPLRKETAYRLHISAILNCAKTGTLSKRHIAAKKAHSICTKL